MTPQRRSIEDLKKLTLRNARGENVFLEGMVEIKEIDAVTSIRHYDRQKSVMVYANLTNGVS